MSSNSVLVTGGAGYIGSHIVLALVDCGYHVVVVDDLSTGLRTTLSPNVPLFVCDVGDERLLSSVFSEYRFGAVIHLAGSAIARESFLDPNRYYRNNFCASRVVFECCVQYGVPRIIFSSTAAVYGAAHNRPVSERSPTAPESPYGVSKHLAEIFLHEVATAHGLHYGCLRYFNVVGADPEGRTGPSNPAAGHLFKTVAEAAVGKRSCLKIYGTDYDTPDGTCIRDYIHVSDLAELHLAALSYLDRHRTNLVLNCGYGRGYSVREVVRAFETLSDREIETHAVQRRIGDVAKLVADISSLKSRLAWRPRHDDLASMVASALAWERDAARAPPR